MVDELRRLWMQQTNIWYAMQQYCKLQGLMENWSSSDYNVGAFDWVLIYFNLRFLFSAQVKFGTRLAVWNGVGNNFSFAGHLVVTLFVVILVKLG